MSSETPPILLTADLLLRLAGQVTYLRGLAYADEGRVVELEIQDGVLVAHVRGTETYTVRLDTEKPALSFDCTCPVGDEVRFCKHCVAVGLTWLQTRGESLVVTAGARPADPSMDRVRAFLDQQDAETLREWLLAEADANDTLRERLLLRDAATGPDAASLKRLRAAIDRATSIPDYIDYDEAPTYAGVLDEMVDGIQAVAQANPADAIDLAEHAIWRVEDALSGIDDSDGMTGDVLQRLQELHLEACEQARPDPVALARRLFEGEMRSEYDSFYGAASAYADVLGDVGIAEYRRLARAQWEGLPSLRPGERDADSSMRRWRITHMMEALAKAEGDVEALVAVHSRDLSQAHAFLKIAEIYREAGDYEKAMDWARRGLKSFPSPHDGRLHTFLADEHHRRGEHEPAMELVWQVFAARPYLDNYKLVKQHADRSRAWKPWRERALAHIRQESGRRVTVSGAYGLSARGPESRTELVRVFLWEGDTEQAWREAQEGGCAPDLWLELARLRKANHPEESLSVYRKQVDRILIATGERAYAEAIRLLPHVRELMERVGKEFSTYLADLRIAHKRRRKLVEMLDRFERRPARR